MEDAQSDCIVSQILEYMIDMQGDIDRKNVEMQEMMSQLILRKYQIRQEEEARVTLDYEIRLTELNVLIEQLEYKLRNIEEENNVKFEVLDK
jgi:hypothetical protein